MSKTPKELINDGLELMAEKMIGNAMEMISGLMDCDCPGGKFKPLSETAERIKSGWNRPDGFSGCKCVLPHECDCAGEPSMKTNALKAAAAAMAYQYLGEWVTVTKPNTTPTKYKAIGLNIEGNSIDLHIRCTKGILSRVDPLKAEVKVVNGDSSGDDVNVEAVRRDPVEDELKHKLDDITKRYLSKWVTISPGKESKRWFVESINVCGDEISMRIKSGDGLCATIDPTTRVITIVPDA